MRYDDMLPYILPSLSGCPEGLALRHLRLAAIDFFNRTGAWTATLETFTTVADTQTYTVPAPSDSVLARLLEVSVDGQAVDELVVPQRAAKLMRDNSGCSFAWVIEQRDIGLWPMPIDDQEVIVEAVLKPSLESLEVPDEYAEHHVHPITQGALEKLLMLPRVPWQSVTDAALCRAVFENAITAAAGHAGTGHLQGRLRVRPA